MIKRCNMNCLWFKEGYKGFLKCNFVKHQLFGYKNIFSLFAQDVEDLRNKFLVIIGTFNLLFLPFQ